MLAVSFTFVRDGAVVDEAERGPGRTSEWEGSRPANPPGVAAGLGFRSREISRTRTTATRHHQAGRPGICDSYSVSDVQDLAQTSSSDDGFCMRTFSLCRALADGNGPQTLQRVQATIGRQLGRLPDQDERAWWLDARSLVQRCNSPGGPGNVWSWLQAASQEPDGPLSQQAAATARDVGVAISCAGQTSHGSGSRGCAR